jgi:hypothetical protein
MFERWHYNYDLPVYCDTYRFILMIIEPTGHVDAISTKVIPCKPATAHRCQRLTCSPREEAISFVKQRLNLDVLLYTLLQIFSLTLFKKVPLNKGSLESTDSLEGNMFHNQLNLFDG